MAPMRRVGPKIASLPKDVLLSGPAVCNASGRKMRPNPTEYLFSVNTRTPPTITVDSGEEFRIEVRGAFDDVDDIRAVPTAAGRSSAFRELVQLDGMSLSDLLRRGPSVMATFYNSLNLPGPVAKPSEPVNFDRMIPKWAKLAQEKALLSCAREGLWGEGACPPSC